MRRLTGGITRRGLLESAGLGSVLGLTGCQEACVSFLDSRDNPWLLVLYGQTASEIKFEFRRQEYDREAEMDRLVEVGGLTAATGGRSPQGGSGSKNAAFQTAADNGDRSFYLLDDLGDASVDGRVYAIDVTSTTARVRGSAGLRPHTLNAPTLALRHIALSPDANQLVVSQAGTPAQWIFIDAATLELQRMVAPENMFPRRAVYSPDGRLVYAVASNLQLDNTSQSLSVQIIDSVTRTIVGSIPLPASTTIEDWAITPDGGLLFGVGNAFVHVLDVASRTYSDRFGIIQPLSGGPTMSGSTERIAMHPDGERLFTLIRRFEGAQAHGAVGVVDVRTARKIAEYPVRVAPGTTGMILTLSPLGATLAAGFQRGPELQMFDTTTGAEVRSIDVGASFGLAGAVAA